MFEPHQKSMRVIAALKKQDGGVQTQKLLKDFL
jgi:hypothetical protein